ncbi:hypothetical protein S40285_04658 [Stachybotrys chlorohalonatus IBT 40285]|uniref:Purine nucleoside permease n=1 Tax=Stachybotrys chlorohalonatus (strain IBT 40285) TaxID=1283841 RepID=A0A084QPH8_STAC4|nr:hypothetical protein S40285_04658 [Stachybotrys chlorohalonata IBT 40285]
MKKLFVYKLSSIWLSEVLTFVTVCAHITNDGPPIVPKVMIVSMWAAESETWHHNFPRSPWGNLTAQPIGIPGLSVLYPQIFCTESGDVCQIVVGEGEINAAASMMALVLSPRFVLTQTYFLIAGIAGVNPHHGTLGSIALAQYSVQVALQYEIDIRSLPDDFSTGYISFGNSKPHEYPTITYGTEVFEVNAQLRDAAAMLARKAVLRDDLELQPYREQYEADEEFEKAAQPPGIIKCDSTTSDVYYSGKHLGDTFEETTRIWTNDSGVYCMTAQEDSASLEVLVRGAVQELVDFSRVIILRAGSNFDRGPPSGDDLEHLASADPRGLFIALENTYLAGIEIISGILSDWDCTYEKGIPHDNYIGDIFGSLGGHPDFGLGSLTDGEPVPPIESRTRGDHLQLGDREMERRRTFGRQAPTKLLNKP